MKYGLRSGKMVFLSVQSMKSQSLSNVEGTDLVEVDASQEQVGWEQVRGMV